MRAVLTIKDTTTLFLSSLLALICLAGCSQDSNKDAKSSETDKIFTVRKSDLIIGTLLRGTANAKEKHKLYPEARFENTLTWIIDENTQVKEGDVVIKFETQDLLKMIESSEVNLDSEEKELAILLEEKRILKSENISSLRAANDTVTNAEESYARYYKYDGKNKKKQLESAVKTKKKGFDDAKDSHLEKSDEIGSTIYSSDEEKAADEQNLATRKATLEKAEEDYNDAVYNLKIFKKYTFPNTLTEKKNDLELAKLNLEKTKIKTASNMISTDNRIRSKEKGMRKTGSELKRYRSYLPQMEIKAPASGILVYGDLDSRRDKIEIEVGKEYKPRRVMVTIPEMDNLIVDYELPEQFRHRVQEGSKVIITPDSMPALKIDGKVDEISMVPVNKIHWDRTSPKIYRSKITLDAQNKSLVSGMNVQVEIIEDTIEQAINIPVEAVFEEDGEFFVYLKGALKISKKIIEIGKSNEKYVHIIKGLEEDDKVFLYSPYELESSE